MLQTNGVSGNSLDLRDQIVRTKARNHESHHGTCDDNKRYIATVESGRKK